MNGATNEDSRMAPTESFWGLYCQLEKKYTFLPFYVWISEFRMRDNFLKTCFLNTQFKKSSEGTVLNFHGLGTELLQIFGQRN